MENTEQELSFDKFFETYKQKIAPILNQFEAERKRGSKIYNITQGICCVCVLYLICFIVLPVILGLMYINVPSLTEPIGKLASFVFESIHANIPIGISVTFIIMSIYMPFLIPIVVLIFTNKISKNFKNKIKNQAMKYILESMDNIKWYKHDKDKPAKHNNSVFSNCKLDKSGLFLNFNEQYVDDEFEGTYKNVDFKISETKLFHSAGKHSYTAFNGIIISFKYNKKIKNRTVIATKGNQTKKQNFTYSLIISAISSIEIFKHGYSHGKLIFAIILFLIFAYIGWKLTKYEEPLNKITLEDPKFNKRFDVYSSDEVEARCLVTPLFMELLYNLKTVFGTKILKCSFFDNNLMIVISTNNDVFEIGDLLTPCDNPKFILKFWEELSSIYKMIEYFKLNEKIYL